MNKEDLIHRYSGIQLSDKKKERMPFTATWVSEVAQLCLTLCDPMDCSRPGFSVHGVFQASVLEWVAISFSRGSSQPRARTQFSRIVDRRFTVWKERKVAQSCPTLCDPMDCSRPGFSVHGIFQARVLEWAAISFSRGSSHPRDRTQVSLIAGRFFTPKPPGHP